MTPLSRATVLLVLVAIAAALGAVVLLHKPADRSCAINPAARQLRDSVRAWAKAEVGSPQRERVREVPTMPSTQIRLATDEALCRRAALAYFGNLPTAPGSADKLHAVAVVRAGKFLVVQDAARPAGATLPILLFDENLKVVR